MSAVEATEKPLFRKGQTVWRQHEGKVQEGKIYEVARITFHSQGYDEDPNGKHFSYRAKFGDDRSISGLQEQHNDGDMWISTFTGMKSEAYRKLAERAHKNILDLIADLSKWAKIEADANQGR